MGPSQVVNRARALLRMVRLGFRDMNDTDQDRALFGFLGVVVFGRSMTLAMQNLRSYDDERFDEWYRPWQEEMKSDLLMRYFSDLRTSVIHKDEPMIGIVLAAVGEGVPPIGSLTVMDLPPPESHLGKPIDDKSMRNLCGLYLTYLQRMFDSFAPIGFEVQDKLLAER